MSDDGLFDLIKEHVSIFDMMERYAPESYKAVRSEDSGHKIPCPFAEQRHPKGADPHPSAKFFPETQSIYCWSCLGSWDVIAFYAEARGLYRTDDNDNPLASDRGGYQLDYGRAAYELGREFQLEYKAPDWYTRLKRITATLKQPRRQAPDANQVRGLISVYEAKMRRPETVLEAAAHDYAMGYMPAGSWVGIERDMHVWFERSQELVTVAGDGYTSEP